ncbi:MAG: hydrogen gas-evolving membrane-bound hydrogenase subunit E [Gammaproteobacteria bacterium]
MIEIVAALILLMIVGALFVVETSNLLYSVVSVGAVGLLAAIAFLFLGAPDVAIVQIAVEVISLVILVRATIGREAVARAGRRSLAGSVAAVVLLVVAGVLGIGSLAAFPPFGAAVMDRIAATPSSVYLEQGLVSTGAPNAVTAVLLDFRAYDTLGEATVLFCAVLGALAVLRRRASAAADGGEAGSGG